MALVVAVVTVVVDVGEFYWPFFQSLNSSSIGRISQVGATGNKLEVEGELMGRAGNLDG